MDLLMNLMWEVKKKDKLNLVPSGLYLEELGEEGSYLLKLRKCETGGLKGGGRKNQEFHLRPEFNYGCQFST